MFTDLVGSTALKRRLGDVRATEIIHRHNQLFRDCLFRFGGCERSNPGDGFFATFSTVSEAIHCALAFQQGLPDLDVPERLVARIGIHAGEFLVIQDDGATLKTLLGLAIDTTARVMGLAEDGQVLVTRAVFELARRSVSCAPDQAPLEWQAHGSYRLKGIDEPFEVFEVGVRGRSPLRAPDESNKATRIVAPSNADAPGWRPGIGLDIPGRRGWQLERQLGKGAFGEVWLARHEQTRLQRVFKFSFQEERVRALKREIVLFRILQESLGDRPDIVRMLECQTDEPPYFLEAEYAGEGHLKEWIARNATSEVAIRLELIAQAADALAAAHSAGILHRDIKPSNLMVTVREDGQPRVRLADFGVGAIINREVLSRHELSLGLTHSATTDGSSATGSQLYLAPELLAGGAASVFSDIYSLGVVLLQVVTGDFRKVPVSGWEQDVSDDLLRETIAACVHVNPSLRLESAGTLARRLRGLETLRQQRSAERAARERDDRRRRQMEARRHLHGKLLFAAGLFFLALTALGIRQSGKLMGETGEALIGETLRNNLQAAHWIAEGLNRELRMAEAAVVRLSDDDRIRRCLAQASFGGTCQSVLADAYLPYRGSPVEVLSVADVAGHLRGRVPHDEKIAPMIAAGELMNRRNWFNGGDPQCRPLTTPRTSDPYVAMSTGRKTMVALSAPVKAPVTPASGGVVVATVSANHFGQWIRRPLAESSATDVEVIVLNDRGQVVLHPRRLADPVPAPSASSPCQADPPASQKWLLSPVEMARGMHAALPDGFEATSFPTSLAVDKQYGWTVMVRASGESPVAKMIARANRVHTSASIATLLLAMGVATIGVMRLLPTRSRRQHGAG